MTSLRSFTTMRCTTTMFFVVCCCAIVGDVATSLRGDDPKPSNGGAPKPAAPASLDDELFKGLDDATTAPGVKPQPSGAAQPPKAERPAATDVPRTEPRPLPKPTDPLDAELLRRLEGEGGTKPPPPAKKPAASPGGGEGDAGPMPQSDDPFQRLSEQIRDAEKRLSRSDSGDQTQELQRKIVEDLDKLITKLEQQQQQQQKSNSQASQPGGKKPQPGPPQQQPGKPGEGRESDSQQARDSRDGTRNTTRRPADPAALKSLLEKAWGRLPERERQDVMQSSVDDFPAKYQFVIEEYFKSLLQRRD